MIKFVLGGLGTVANVYCDHCETQIKDIGMGAVVFDYETGEHWFAHKRECHYEIEALLAAKGGHNSQAGPHYPWWELEFFFKDVMRSFEKDDNDTHERGWENGSH